MTLRWWKTADEIREEVLTQVRKERAEEKAADLKLAEEFAEKKAADEKIEQEKRDKEPWVDIRGMLEDPKHGIKVDLDWNDAFIEYLRDNGITGADEEIVVQKWITMLYRDLMDQQGVDGENNGLV